MMIMHGTDRGYRAHHRLGEKACRDCRHAHSVHVSEQRAANAVTKIYGRVHRPAPWTVDALCPQTDPEVFFPDKGGSTREAKQVCMACPVRLECLQLALDNDERFGIWGGMSERERRRLKSGRAA